jgi:hypothetical protein
MRRVKYWQTIASKLSARGLSWGCSSETDANGRVLYTADAFGKEGKRFTVLAADKLTAFLELERQVLGQTSKLTWEKFALRRRVRVACKIRNYKAPRGILLRKSGFVPDRRRLSS